MPVHRPLQQRSLLDLPNISVALAEALRRCGVSYPQALFELGTERAWRLLRQAGVRPCIQSALAVEGAILGTSWQAVPPARRQQLMRFVSQELG
ncbi:MAG TPA: TfoX/Sxy family DNA transformation protein [Opitutaceae bacterium]|nr:TfoX/Sxy family DNA transformation protein [Opitutaceae bacterium]